jgi:hypothetical protein
VHSRGIPFPLAGTDTVVSITAISSTSSTWTFTAANDLKVGDVVVVSGCTPTAYNGTWTVATANSTTFTVTHTGNPGAGTVFGTAVVGAFVFPKGVTIYNWILSETGGSTDLTLDFYQPGPSSITPGVPDTTGTLLFTIVVTKGTVVKDRWEEGLGFPNGLYVDARGGVAGGSIFYQ